MLSAQRAALAATPFLLLLGCASAPRTALPAAPAGDYRIAPGDQLSIVVWRNSEASHVAPVRPDGKITTPLVEDMLAVGKTPTELGRDLEKALARYIREPVVSVVVTNVVGSHEDQIRVIGETGRAQGVAFRKGMTLLDVMIAVGGIGEYAAGNRASLTRRAVPKPFKIRLHDLLRRGDLSANVDVQPGDVIYIPESLF